MLPLLIFSFAMPPLFRFTLLIRCCWRMPSAAMPLAAAMLIAAADAPALLLPPCRAALRAAHGARRACEQCHFRATVRRALCCSMRCRHAAAWRFENTSGDH